MSEYSALTPDQIRKRPTMLRPARSLLILAPSCSGKTHFANRTWGSNGARVVDGDHVVSASIGWLDWRKLSSEQSVAQNERYAKVIALFLKQNSDATVVFNGHADAVKRALAEHSPNTKLVGVILTDTEYARNVALRQAGVKKGVGSHSQPITREEVMRGVESARKEYPAEGIPVVASFDAVAAKFGLYQKERA